MLFSTLVELFDQLGIFCAKQANDSWHLAEDSQRATQDLQTSRYRDVPPRCAPWCSHPWIWRSSDFSFFSRDPPDLDCAPGRANDLQSGFQLSVIKVEVQMMVSVKVTSLSEWR